MADALAAKQQAVEIGNQQKEAEAARAKEKQMWLAQIEEKEKERKVAITKQAEEVYAQAVELYKHKKFADAKKKFEEVSWVIPDYKATMKYLSRIDRDAKLEQERVAQEQQKALQEQHWEEEVQQKKQEALRQQELEVKKRQHKKDLEEQAQFLYTAAVSLYDKKNMDEALDKFNDIDKLLPGYKSTSMYLARIQQWKIDQQKHQQVAVAPVAIIAPTPAPAASKPAQEAPPPAAVAPEVENFHQQEMALERQRAQDLKDRAAQAEKIYSQAVKSYRAHRWEEARTQFESVEQLVTDYKHTHRYLQKVDDLIAKTAKAAAVQAPGTPAVMSSPAPTALTPPPPPVPVETPAVIRPVVPPVQPKAAVSLEDQQKQTQDIAALAEKSAQLYSQIADIADDNSTVQTKKKMAEVDEILNNLKDNKEHCFCVKCRRNNSSTNNKRQGPNSRSARPRPKNYIRKAWNSCVRMSMWKLRSNSWN